MSTSLLRRARRLWWVGSAGLALGALGTLLAVLSVKRTYRSEAVILYDRGLHSSPLPITLEPELPRVVALRLQDALMSRKRLEGLIRELKLYPNIVEQRGMVEAVDEMRLHIGFSGKEGFTFKLSFDANDRETAQTVANKLCQSLIDEDAKARQDDAMATKKFTEAEKLRVHADLKVKETALAEFLSKHPTLASEASLASVSAGGTIRAANRGDRSAEIVSLELQAAQLEQMLRASNTVDTTVKVNGRETTVDPALMEARARAMAALSAARRDLGEKQQRFTNEHPDVKVALGHVADAEAELKRAEAAVAGAATATASGAKIPDRGVSDEGGGRADSIRRALSGVRSQIAAINAAKGDVRPESGKDMVAVDTEFTRLARDVAEARERGQQLDSRDFQAQLLATLSATGRIGRILVVDPAFRPSRPIAGSRSKVALGGMAAAVGVALLALLGAAAFDRRLFASWDVRQVVGDDRFVVVIPPWESEDDAER